jgi:hypothetical protein
MLRREIPEYKIWQSMRQRCNNSNNAAYPNYGGRGIMICDRWDDFTKFYEDMGPRPTSRYCLDRVDNEGNYCPENCRWATYVEQNRNRRSNKIILHEGQSQCLEKWAETFGISSDTILKRLDRGWKVDEALTTPIQFQEITYNGDTRSVEEWAKISGISATCLRRRIRSGWLISDLFLPVKTKPKKTRKKDDTTLTVEYLGELIPYTELSRRYDIPTNVLHSRLVTGWSVDDAMNKPIRNPEELEFNGKKQTVAQWSREIGISHQTLRYRLKKGWDLEKALYSDVGNSGPPKRS